MKKIEHNSQNPQPPLENHIAKIQTDVDSVRGQLNSDEYKNSWFLSFPELNTGKNHYLLLNRIQGNTFEETNEITLNTYNMAVAEHGEAAIQNIALNHITSIQEAKLFENNTIDQAFEIIWFIKHFLCSLNSTSTDKFIEFLPELRVIFAHVNFIKKE